jgi:cytokinesis protein
VDDFHYPRPEKDEEIEALFERVRARLGINDSSNITMEQKWQIVHQDEQARYREERKKQHDIKRLTATGLPVGQVVAKDSPSWYLKKFMEQAVTPKHVQSLAVSLRTMPIG